MQDQLATIARPSTSTHVCVHMQVGGMCFRLGYTTNNVAEYNGLLKGLEAALALGVKRIQCQGDSKLVVEQVVFASPASQHFVPGMM